MTEMVLPVLLFPLPCGCTVSSANRLGAVVECPWCGAVFSFAEYKEWEPPLVVLLAPAKLYRFGGKVLSFVRQCEGCAAPVMREGSGVKFHLPAAAEHFEKVWD